ncbi:hypothetical protein Q4561_13175 [Alteromonas sp. 1_MG-2023]|uniref:hypothetical protein n=1 Tax=Alteromonas sp. 1_MG-2023 TaxID=3062669 RepID=UPI0026E43E7C|nr:hypothetical protein [Alteromonas sp. 1_MG-2023]MDO6568018.1 hypothetical protein [Alteromonas sp. 1_MG-2023]
MFKRCAVVYFLALISFNAVSDTQVLLRGNVISADNADSFQTSGASHQRFDNKTFALSQAVIAFNGIITDDWQLNAVANGYSDGDQKLGFSQLYTQYRPLTPSTIKPEVKLGFFYPAISAENTDMGWLSPHFLSNSAINSWIGEELRTFGVEASLRQSGRQVRSNWSWKVSGSLFKGNDTTGTLLSWRGFALHDRQSLHDDRVKFLPIPGVVSEDGIDAPAWTEPFREIDTKTGYYAGVHVAHKRSSELRYYYFDNRADPLIFDPDKIYAWRTRFHSLTLRHMKSRQFTVFGQVLLGDTLMGENVVKNDFHAAYIAATYSHNKHLVSARLDWYQVIDRDNTLDDPNSSRGEAITVNYTFEMTPQIALSAEWQINRGTQENLRFFNATSNAIPDETFHENLLQLALTYRIN